MFAPPDIVVKPTTRFYFKPGAVSKIESLLNFFLSRLGRGEIVSDGNFSPDDGIALKIVQNELYNLLPINESIDKKKAFYNKLKELALLEPPFTGEQMFAAINQDPILQTLSDLKAKIEQGKVEFPRKSLAASVNGKNLLIYAAVGIGVLWLLG